MSDLHLPQKMIIFAVGKVTMCFPFFSCLAAKGLVRCVKMRCKIILEIQLIENKEVTLLMQLNW